MMFAGKIGSYGFAPDGTARPGGGVAHGGPLALSADGRVLGRVGDPAVRPAAGAELHLLVERRARERGCGYTEALTDPAHRELVALYTGTAAEQPAAPMTPGAIRAEVGREFDRLTHILPRLS